MRTSLLVVCAVATFAALPSSGAPLSPPRAVGASSAGERASLAASNRRGELTGPAELAPSAELRPVVFRFRYASPFRGWPVAPLHRQHPIRSPFLEPRPGGYHYGVDIAVDDLRRERGAPPGRSHRVYAVDSGYAVVGHSPTPHPRSCRQRRVGVGPFVYWHVDPIVGDGEYVRAGEAIGWTCSGQWHVHLSEWTLVGGRQVWVNPLHPGGKLLPYTDTAAPSIRSLRFFTPARGPWRWLGHDDTARPLRADALHGRVELRARVEDRVAFTGWLGRYGLRAAASTAPYALAVRVTAASGRVVLSRVTFRSGRLPVVPVTVHFAPSTAFATPLCRLVDSGSRASAGRLWFRPFSRMRLEYWDTRAVPDGVYFVAVTASDVSGNRSRSVVRVEVANGEERTS